MKRLTIILTLTLISSTVYAQETIQADRPGFGFGSYITPDGTFSIESGVTTSEFGTNVGELFIRAGIANSFEVQFEAGSIFFPDGGDSFRSPQYAILKYNVYANASNSLRISLLNRTLLPFLNKDFDDYFTQFLILGDFIIDEQLSLNMNLGYGNFLFSDFDLPSYYLTINPGYSINNSLSAYLGFSYSENEFSDFINYEMGVSYLINSDTQVDLGLIINEDSDPFLQIGFATRF